MQNALIYLILFFLGRLFFLDMNQVIKGEKAPKRNIWYRILLALGLFVFIPNAWLALIYFAFYFFFTMLDTLVTPQNTGRRILWYAALIVAPFLVALRPFHLPVGQMIPGWIPETKNSEHLLTILLGYILILKEGTIVIRLALNGLKTTPVSDDQQETDQDEYERGKWIGILERTFIYFLIIFDQIGAIALIVALKSLARFNELNKRPFAEYFLIGSFLSLLVAALPAVIVRLLFN